MTTNKKQIKKEINEAQEPLRDTAKDIPLLLACILKELEENNKYLKLLSKLSAIDHGIE